MQWSLRLEILDRLYLLQEIMVLFGQDGDIRSEKHRLVGRYDTILKERALLHRLIILSVISDIVCSTMVFNWSENSTFLFMVILVGILWLSRSVLVSNIRSGTAIIFSSIRLENRPCIRKIL